MKAYVWAHRTTPKVYVQIRENAKGRDCRETRRLQKEMDGDAAQF